MKNIFFISLILLLLTGASYLFLYDKSNVDKIVLGDNIYTIDNKLFIYPINNLKSQKYNIIFMVPRTDQSAKILLEKNSKFLIQAEVSDQQHNQIVALSSINENSKNPESYSQEAIWLQLLSFVPSKDNYYQLKLNFIGFDNNLNKLPKQIYLEADYDYATLPWLGLFTKISLILVIIFGSVCGLFGVLLLSRRSRGRLREG